MADHTTGPWNVVLRGEKLHIDAHDGGFAVARVFESQSPVGKANADLIAAAPELLDVLKTLYIDLDSNGEVLGSDEERLKVIRSAIEKAEGRQA